MKSSLIFGACLLLLATTSAYSTDHYYTNFIQQEPECKRQNSTLRGYCDCLQFAYTNTEQHQLNDISRGITSDEESADAINFAAEFMTGKGCLVK